MSFLRNPSACRSLASNDRMRVDQQSWVGFGTPGMLEAEVHGSGPDFEGLTRNIGIEPARARNSRALSDHEGR
jgi:hypothetical protein